MTAAFEALELFPALAESRNRVLALVSEERPSTGDVVQAIESDVALVIAVFRLANNAEGVRRGGTLLSVRTDMAHAAQVEEILNRHGSVDAKAKGHEYRERGWTGFDEKAPAFTADDIAKERSRIIGRA